MLIKLNYYWIINFQGVTILSACGSSHPNVYIIFESSLKIYIRRKPNKKGQRMTYSANNKANANWA